MAHTSTLPIATVLKNKFLEFHNLQILKAFVPFDPHHPRLEVFGAKWMILRKKSCWRRMKRLI